MTDHCSPCKCKTRFQLAASRPQVNALRVQDRAINGNLHSCRDAKQSMQTEAASQFLCCVAGICWHKAVAKAWSRVSNSRVDREPGVGGCGCGRRCGVRVGSMAIHVLRCDLHSGGMARLRGVKAAILIHFILPCQRRARTSHLFRVMRQLAVGFHTRGCAGVGGGFA